MDRSSLPGSFDPRLALSVSRRQGASEPVSTDRMTSEDTRDATLEAARQFESLLVQQMLRTMRAASGSGTTSNAMEIHQDRYDGEIARLVTEGGGLGLAETLARQLGADPASGARADSPDDLGRLRALVASDRQTLALKQPSVDADDGKTPGPERTVVAGRDSRWALSLWTNESSGSTTGSRDAHAVKRDFVDAMKPLVGPSARRLGTSTLPIIAVAAHESGWGRKLPEEDGRVSHNLFGIKATHSDPDAVAQRTTEYRLGQRTSETARFRAYRGPADAIEGFADFLEHNPRYRTALAHAANPERFVRELHRAGYATDPAYADKVIRVMQELRALDPDLEGAETT